MSEGLGFTPGQVVQEFYYDEDCDHALREGIEAETGHHLVDFDHSDMVDGLIVWWRSDDAEQEDLTDVLMDAAANLDDHGGIIWVLSPKAGRDDAVAVEEITEAASIAGLSPTSATSVGPEWAGLRLTARPRTN